MPGDLSFLVDSSSVLTVLILAVTSEDVSLAACDDMGADFLLLKANFFLGADDCFN